MTALDDLQQQYIDLEFEIDIKPEAEIRSQALLVFEYDYPEQSSVIDLDTEEFTAVCPWTGLPDYGSLLIRYIPSTTCIELKSLKYYLLSFRDVGIVQEHAANRILKDLVKLCSPKFMKVTLDYKPRGGIHTTVTVEHPEL
ncbi:MAG TPA: NADPH-dependent 7-cyano-7-deazaguanine reductase QueF [Dehalococcoidia bacterium]|jgi:7-cyano-7-deazaguanine reductase|nr:NADPH-dependent 7-cyano-7-deazaguanine reductase QueF [Dehalococcoidia bacterium]|tara:strand:+ start:319 stop:741 length:423 start_codon:yes stop_codon:yes gene_type:complete